MDQYKTHYSDNKVKIELQTMSWKTDWAEMVSKNKNIHDGKGEETSVLKFAIN